MSLRNFFRKNKAISISFLAFFSGAVALCAIIGWFHYQNKKLVFFQNVDGNPFGNKYLSIKMEIPLKSDGSKNCWLESNGTWGSQYDIFIYNNSKAEFVDWDFEMTVPDESRLDSSWNAEYELDSGKLRAKGLESAFTTKIHPYSSVKLGFVLYSNKLMSENKFYLSGRFIRNLLHEKSFLATLIFLAVSLIFFVVSLIFSNIAKKQAEIDNGKIESLLRLCASFIDARDQYTNMHSSHVGLYSKKIAKEMGFDEDFQRNIYYMGMMHDVGKVLIPREILCKVDRLDETEWPEMRKHTIYGALILQNFMGIDGIKDAALYHHERYDGNGYPNGLKGNEIPLVARIIAVADAYDAMHTNRSYRNHLNDEIIFNEIEKNKGIQFDPAAADALLRLLKRNALE